jgi:hypothetical protein
LLAGLFGGLFSHFFGVRSMSTISSFRLSFIPRIVTVLGILAILQVSTVYAIIPPPGTGPVITTVGAGTQANPFITTIDYGDLRYVTTAYSWTDNDDERDPLTGQGKVWDQSEFDELKHEDQLNFGSWVIVQWFGSYQYSYHETDADAQGIIFDWNNEDENSWYHNYRDADFTIVPAVNATRVSLGQSHYYRTMVDDSGFEVLRVNKHVDVTVPAYVWSYGQLSIVQPAEIFWWRIDWDGQVVWDPALGAWATVATNTSGVMPNPFNVVMPPPVVADPAGAAGAGAAGGGAAGTGAAATP